MGRDRAHIHRPTGLGARIADRVSSSVGSWPFILIQSSILAVWIILNSAGWFLWHWDAPPFILLNLCLSFQAAFTGPFVMMSQNRQAEKDRLRDNHEAEEVDEMFTNHELLIQINRQQLEILNRLDKLEKPEDDGGVWGGGNGGGDG